MTSARARRIVGLRRVRVGRLVMLPGPTLAEGACVLLWRAQVEVQAEESMQMAERSRA